MATIVMDADGRLTVPEEAREALGLDGETELQVEVGEAEGVIVLRPLEPGDDDDSWLYSPETIERVERARADAKAGRLRQMSVEELEQIAREADERERL